MPKYRFICFFLPSFMLFMICQQEYFMASKPWPGNRRWIRISTHLMDTHTIVLYPPTPDIYVWLFQREYCMLFSLETSFKDRMSFTILSHMFTET